VLDREKHPASSDTASHRLAASKLRPLALS
jgi:hypothetical protein